MVESNLHALDINLIAAMSEEDEENSPLQVSEMFFDSPWYSDIMYVLQNLSSPPGTTRNKGRNLKLKAAKFCILNSSLYWKELGGVLLNCLVEEVLMKWDAMNEDKVKHGKFENLCKGPFKIAGYRGQNAFLLKEINGEDCPGGTINGRLLKQYHF